MQRDTRQRRAIQQVFDNATRPLGPEEILADAKRLVAGLGLATVYRALAAMQQKYLIVPVEIPGHAPRYEKAGLKHHHHCVCTDCGMVFEMEGCAYTSGKGVPDGFKVEGHEVILHGYCRDCRSAPATERR